MVQNRMPILMWCKFKNLQKVKKKVLVIRKESVQGKIEKAILKVVKLTSKIWLKM